MKKQSGKPSPLRLSKQTIRRLTTAETPNVRGGLPRCPSCTHTQWTEPPFNSEACSDTRL